MQNTSNGAVPAPDPRRWFALSLLCAAFFMVCLDGQIVLLALPSIEHQLGYSPAGVQWVVSAYMLALGGLLLLGGRLADIWGRRIVFLTATAAFLLASLACGMAMDGAFLIAARVIQGVAAAPMKAAQVPERSTQAMAAAQLTAAGAVAVRRPATAPMRSAKA
jgi:MFS family permease